MTDDAHQERPLVAREPAREHNVNVVHVISDNFEQLRLSLERLAEETGSSTALDAGLIADALDQRGITNTRVITCMSSLWRLTSAYERLQTSGQARTPYKCSFCAGSFVPSRIVLSSNCGVCQNCALDFVSGQYSRDRFELTLGVCSFCRSGTESDTRASKLPVAVYAKIGESPQSRICKPCVTLALEMIFEATMK